MKPTIISVEVSRTGYTSPVTGTIGAAVNSIGGTGQAGGIIFYVDTAATVYPGKTYLEAAPTDIESSPGTRETYEWATSDTDISGAAGTDIGDGQANTAAILAVDPAAPAAAACNSLTVGIYNDWFLPSKDELHAIWTSGIAGTTANPLNGFDTSGTYYCSSSQSYTDSALNQRFSDGYQGDYYKNSTYYVRAVRAF